MPPHHAMHQRIVPILAVILALLVIGGDVAPAATLTGIVVYSTDGRGIPVGFRHQSATIEGGQLWQTGPSPHWYGLGVLRGLPPESFEGRLLNASDFRVRIPLEAGELDFTLLGEPGLLSDADAYDLWALNIFLDGVVDRPAISVLFPPGAYRYGVPPSANEAEVTIALPVVPVSASAQDSYDDGHTKITVNGVSFLPPHRFVDVDLVSSTAPVPNGQSDWVGVLRLSVETTAADAGGGGGSAGAPRPMGPEVFGIIPAEGVVVGGGGVLDPGSSDVLRDRPSGWRSAPLKTPTPSTTDPVGEDDQTPRPEGSQSPTPPSTSGTATPPAGTPTQPPATPGPTGSVTGPPGPGSTTTVPAGTTAGTATPGTPTPARAA